MMFLIKFSILLIQLFIIHFNHPVVSSVLRRSIPTHKYTLTDIKNNSNVNEFVENDNSSQSNDYIQPIFDNSIQEVRHGNDNVVESTNAMIKHLVEAVPVISRSRNDRELIASSLRDSDNDHEEPNKADIADDSVDKVAHRNIVARGMYIEVQVNVKKIGSDITTTTETRTTMETPTEKSVETPTVKSIEAQESSPSSSSSLLTTMVTSPAEEAYEYRDGYNNLPIEGSDPPENVEFNNDDNDDDNNNDFVENDDGERNDGYPFNQSNIYNYLMRYESEGGNACLLDDFKEYLMWWSYPNGTLKEWPFNFKLELSAAMDLSHNEVLLDESLYELTRNELNSEDGIRRIIIFSAAYNNLTSVPYHTLSLLNDTLQYLTLRGNQFAACSQEMQMEKISRYLNDTTHRKNDAPMQTTTIPEDNEANNENDNDTNEFSEAHPSMDNANNDCAFAGEYASQHNQHTGRRKFWRDQEQITDKEFGIAWATFPPMGALLELDISNCRIEYVGREAFQNLTSLRRLYMSHNKMLTIPFDAFAYVPRLQYLDLSHTNVLEFNYLMPLPTLEAIFNLIYGVKVQQMTFRDLTELVYLDFSHTKLTRNSAVAFTHLGEKLQFLSLCYTSFPMLGNVLFKNTNLIALDLSGNPYVSTNIIDDAFEGVAATLRYLYFESSNIKEISWLKYLENLRVLGLAGNNVNYVSEEVFAPLRSLQILDMSSNHVGNWYHSAFSQNPDLRVLNLRDNNINMITSEMLKDFQSLEYLSLGINNFVCDCMLVDFVNVAAKNKKHAECDYNTRRVLLEARAATISNRSQNSIREIYDQMDDLVWLHYRSKIHRKIVLQPKQTRNQKNQQKTSLRLRFFTKTSPTTSESSVTHCSSSDTATIQDSKVNESAMHFQLLDYEDDSYWCFNETERLNFRQLECQTRSYPDDIVNKLDTLTNSLLGVLGTIICLAIIGTLAYWKRWHIFYYYSSLKSAALLSVAAKDNAEHLSKMAERDPNLVYDIFVSYCQNDRQWVLEELLPNVEETGDVSICLHERDFEIGLAILDNIISCMDRSRALMLIISSNFLLSHWCQFEMHLAQHRILEVSKEHLILVFLEDIPRSKRPKTLQYLMDIKTYIRWPAAKSKSKQVKAEDRKIFWRRLKRALHQIDPTQS